MLLLLLVATTVAYGLAIYGRIHTRNIDIALGYMLGVTYFCLIPLWLLALTNHLAGGYRIPEIRWSRDQEAISTLLIMLLAAAPILFLFKYKNRTPHRPWSLFNSVMPKSKLRPIHLLLIYVTVVLVQFLALGLGRSESHWAASRTDFQQTFGIIGSLFLVLCSSIRHGIALYLILAVLRKHSLSYFLLIALATVELYSTGVRLLLFQMVITILVYKLSSREYRIPAIIALLAVPLAVAMIFFSSARGQLHSWKSTSAKSAVSSLKKSIAVSSDYYSNRLNLKYGVARITEASSLNVFKAVVETYPSRRPYLGGSTLIKPAVAWIPRSVWEDKPVNFPTIIGQQLVRDGVSLNSTSMGEPYANLGFAGVIYIPILLYAICYIFETIDNVLLIGKMSSLCVFVVGFTVTRNGVIETVLPFTLALVFLSLCQGSSTTPPPEPRRHPNEAFADNLARRYGQPQQQQKVPM